MNVEGETRPGVRLLKSWINKSIKVVSLTKNHILMVDLGGNVRWAGDSGHLPLH